MMKAISYFQMIGVHATAKMTGMTGCRKMTGIVEMQRGKTMADTFEFTLDEESEKKLFEIMTDVDTEKVPSFTITDKYGNTAEYVKVTKCRECKYDHTCTHDMVRRTVCGGYIYCPVVYCSEGKRKEE